MNASGRLRKDTNGSGTKHPWLVSTSEGQQIVRMGFADPGGHISEESAHRANIWFRRYADTNRDLRPTDEEIRITLVQAAQQRRGGY